MLAGMMRAIIMCVWHFGQAGRWMRTLTCSGWEWDSGIMHPSKRRERNTLGHRYKPVK